MNEGAKTGIFWCIAAVMVGIATFVAWPRSVDSDTSKLIGTQLFPDFEDPLVAASMKIVTYDDEQGTLSQFEVSKDPQTGVWKIPTHAGYPADAEDQMRSSATALFDLAILDVPSKNAEDHAQFGVLEPDPENLKVGDEGVGRLVDFRDEQGEKLATLIVGDEVPNFPQQRYVRKPTQDVVYVVELDTSPLSTRFVDWIDNDLLQLTAFDIDRVTLNNYTASFDMGSGQVAQNKKFEAQLKLDGTDWDLEQLVTFKDGLGVPKQLGEDEELNSAKLNELKQALDELKIAGVGRKPEGMSANLKADKSLINDQNALVSLLQRGFIPLGSADSDEVDILAANGELVVTQKDGVEYVLRFGEIAGASNEVADDETTPIGSNRYMLVTARVNESQIPLPDLEETPQTIEELDAAAEAESESQPEADPAAQSPSPVSEIPVEATETEATDAADDAELMEEEEATSEPAEPATEEPSEAPSDDAAAETPDATEAEADSTDENATEDADTATDADAPTEPEAAPDSEESPSDEEASDNDDSSDGESGDGEPLEEQESVEELSGAASQIDRAVVLVSAAAQEAADENESADPVDTESEAPETTVDAEQANEATPAADAVDAEAVESGSEEPAQPEETEQEKQERLEAAQERIAKENQRKLDEREESIQQARQRVAELNARFADWYYEISESTFRNLRLSEDDLIISADDAEAQEAAPPSGFPQGGFPQGGAVPQFSP